MGTKINLTDEKFEEIKTNKKFRNEVANAHGYANSSGKRLGYTTSGYPLAYIVTPKQINIANRLKKKEKEETLKSIKPNQLVFVSMGMDFDKDYEKDVDYEKEIEKHYGRVTKKEMLKLLEEYNTHRENLQKSDILNYRFRTYLLDNNGKEFFVEFSTCRSGLMHVDFSLDVENDKYNYGGIHGVTGLPLTKENVLNIVNRTFDCNFNEFILDRYDLSPSDYKSISKKD